MEAASKFAGTRGVALFFGAALTAGCMGSGPGEARLDAIGDRLIGPAGVDTAAHRVGAPGRDGRQGRSRPDRIQANMREAPERFAATATIGWDGRPTLGGLWIAHPDVVEAGRVRITNPETGTRIDAALLPRRSKAGAHRVVVSSEAADGLGMAPGIALTVAMVAIEPDLPGAPLGVDGTVAAAPLAPEIAAVDSGERSVEGAAAGIAGKPEATDAAAERMAGAAPDEGVPGNAGSPEATDATAELAAGAAPDPGAAGDRTTATPAPPAANAPAERDAAPAPTADHLLAAIATLAPAAAADPAPEPGPLPPETPISDNRPYVRAGSFAEPAYAADLVRTLDQLGVPARSSKVTIGGKAMITVVAGPFTTHGGRDNAMKRLREIGVSDPRPTEG